MKRVVFLFFLIILFVANAVPAHENGYKAIHKFPLQKCEIALKRHVHQGTYCEAVGRAAAVLGREEGIFEAWVYPFKILYDLQLSFQLPNQTHPFEASSIAHTIRVDPASVLITYSHPAFTVRQLLFTPLCTSGSIILLDVTTSTPLDILVSFFPDLNPMWPGGMGGQFCYWDEDASAYSISESRWKFFGMIGSPHGSPRSSPPAHQLAATPTRFAIHVDPEFAARHYYPIIIAGEVGDAMSGSAANGAGSAVSSAEGAVNGKATNGIEDAVSSSAATGSSLEDVKGTYRRLLGTAQELYEETCAYYERLRADFTSVTLPNKTLERAYEWAKVAIDKGFVNNPHLGSGLVAGYGTSGVGRRPGFAWFFGGDAFMNAFALHAYGDFHKARAAFAFLRKYQRDDGKMMHELSQAGGLIPWFEQYPYGYIHGDTTPYYLALMAEYLRCTADTTFIRNSWDSLLSAYRWCLSCDGDGDYLMDNPLAGLGAAELGSLRQNIKTDIYLASVWVAGLGGMATLAEAAGDADLVVETKNLHQRALESLRRAFYNPEKQLINFALSQSGAVNDEITAWPSVPLFFGFFDEKHARPMLDYFASGVLSTDWGVRMLSTKSAAYAPLSYNNGAVWPFLTGFVSLAEYTYQRSDAAFLHLQQLARLTEIAGLGYVTELLSGDLYRPLDSSVPHQLFSSSQLCRALLRGLFGLHGDAARATVRVSPQIPAAWDHASVLNFHLGESRFNFHFKKENNTLRYICEHEGATPHELNVSPFLPLGSTVHEVEIDGNPVDYSIDSTERYYKCSITTTIADRREITIIYDHGISVEVPLPEIEIGGTSRGLKILRHTYSEPKHSILVEGFPGCEYKMGIECDKALRTLQGAELLHRAQDALILRIEFTGEKGDYVRKEIQLIFEEHAKN